MEYDLNRENNKYRFDSFGNIGEPTDLDVVVNDRIGTDVNVLDVIKDNKQYFYDNIKHLNCYVFSEHVIRLFGQPVPIYTIKQETQAELSPLIRYYRNGVEITNVRFIVDGNKYFDSIPLDTIITGESKTYEIADLFYQWRTDPNYKPLEVHLAVK